MSLADEIQRDIARSAERELPAKLTWAGTEFPCVRGLNRRQNDFVTGGKEVDVAFRVMVRMNAQASDGATMFSSTPAPTVGKSLSVDSETYHIESVSKANGYYVLGLKDPSKR